MTVAATATASDASLPARRRRGAELENALLDAAWDELQESGFAHLTMERVAERAGTSRAVLYRRWPGRGPLVFAAIRRRQAGRPGRVPDTGTVRGDVLAVLRAASLRIVELGPDTMVGLLGELFSDEDGSTEALAQLTRGGGEVMGAVLERARARGEVRTGVTPRVARLPLDLLRHELILTRQPPSDAALEEIVDDVFLPLVSTPG